MTENVRARMDDGAATVLSAILKATRNIDKNVKIEQSGDLDLLHEYWKSMILVIMSFGR